MSQEQAQRDEPVKYGDLFNVSGELSTKPVAPQDAAMMQAAEGRVYGRTRKGGPAAAMQKAATLNERAGVVAHTDVSRPTADRGVTVTETDLPGARILTEAVAGQVVAEYVEPTPVAAGEMGSSARELAGTGITIGDALEAAAQIAGDKPVEQSDAAAIQAAEARATGSSLIAPGSLASAAQSAATGNRDKVKLGDVLMSATTKLAKDKVATRQDAEGVARAELRNEPEQLNHPGVVGTSVKAAVRLNERH